MQNYELEAKSVVERPAPDVNPETKKFATNTKKSAEEISNVAEYKKKREAELRSKLELQITKELESELKSKLKAEIESELTEKLEFELRSTIEQEVETELEAKLKAEIEDELTERLEIGLRLTIEQELEEELKLKLKVELEAELIEKLELELRSTIEQEVETELESKLKAKLESELTEKVEGELRSTIEQEFELKLKQHLIAKIAVKTNPKPDIEVETEFELESADPIEFDMETKQIIEAILFAAEKPMTSKQIRNVYPELERPELKEIQLAIDAIVVDYQSRAIALKQLASGYRFQVKDGFSYWVSRLFEEKPPRYSRALLETIAIIAYRQPVTRGDIEDIRGVSVSSNIIRTLLDREWVRIIAHKEVPGRPALYGTTKQFLDYFNVSSLDQLPTLEEIKDLDFSSGNLLSPSDPEKNEHNLSQENITKKKSIEEQTSEEQTTEKSQAIEPISETRH